MSISIDKLIDTFYDANNNPDYNQYKMTCVAIKEAILIAEMKNLYKTLMAARGVLTDNDEKKADKERFDEARKLVDKAINDDNSVISEIDSLKPLISSLKSMVANKDDRDTVTNAKETVNRALDATTEILVKLYDIPEKEAQRNVHEAIEAAIGNDAENKTVPVALSRVLDGKVKSVAG